MGLLRCLRTPPGVTARSAMPCHAPLTPVHSSDGTLRPCGHCAKRHPHYLQGLNASCQGVLARVWASYGACGPAWGLLSRSATPCHAPRTPAHSSEGTFRPFRHCATTDYPTFCKVRRRLRTCFGMLVNSTAMHQGAVEAAHPPRRNSQRCYGE